MEIPVRPIPTINFMTPFIEKLDSISVRKWDTIELVVMVDQWLA